MKWIRKKAMPNRPPEKYHVPRQGEPTQDTHYLTTLCRSEIKAMYYHWEITEDPDGAECCAECLRLLDMEKDLPDIKSRRDQLILKPVRHIDGD